MGPLGLSGSLLLYYLFAFLPPYVGTVSFIHRFCFCLPPWEQNLPNFFEKLAAPGLPTPSDGDKHENLGKAAPVGVGWLSVCCQHHI